jgi:membrane-bound lytic murein transglycosylase B
MPHHGPVKTSAARVALIVVVTILGLVGVLALAILRLGTAEPAYALEPAPSAAATPASRPAAQRSSRSAPRQVVDPAWVARTSAAAGIPGPALRAYAAAELILRAEQPGCRLGWNTLAGIGWIESQHGTIDGRTMLADGRSSRPILGPALDGSGDFAAIRSTPASADWHGDTVWDHAIGPLQFLTSTWERWGADGDRDGSADPRDLDDAALAAGRYLCADDHDLATDAGWSAAVYSYNHDIAYVADVAAAANAYVRRTR